jgi:hypothetical protein
MKHTFKEASVFSNVYWMLNSKFSVEEKKALQKFSLLVLHCLTFKDTGYQPSCQTNMTDIC